MDNDMPTYSPNQGQRHTQCLIISVYHFREYLQINHRFSWYLAFKMMVRLRWTRHLKETTQFVGCTMFVKLKILMVL